MKGIYLTALLCLGFLLSLYLLAYYTERKSRNSKWIELYLRLRRHNPYYGYILALTSKNDKAVISNYRRLVKLPLYRRLYPEVTILFCFYFNSTKGIEGEIEKITCENKQKFFRQVLKIGYKKEPLVKEELCSIDNLWMKEVLYALADKQKGDFHQELYHWNKGLNDANGIIYYTLEKVLNR
ncbi:hypothetical protein M3612_07885 [Niallia taxi]|uniref:hypothetical protein n=1 Tax=Niallia taxi TaxID=2499688 RepID=UPI00203E8AF0|nr:hypothetical protein [Niallia taxi]MCM3214426.1 hypothetical protein [Niallia taxi]